MHGYAHRQGIAKPRWKFCVHAKSHFTRSKGLSLAGQDILLKITCTHRHIHGQIQGFLKLEGRGVVWLKKKMIACVLLHAIGNICIITRNTKFTYG